MPSLNIFLSLCCVFKIANDIANRIEVVELFVFNGYVEFLFAEINKVCKLKRIDAKVTYKLSFHSDIIFVHAKLFNEKLLKIFKHNLSSF